MKNLLIVFVDKVKPTTTDNNLYNHYLLFIAFKNDCYFLWIAINLHICQSNKLGYLAVKVRAIIIVFNFLNQLSSF